MHVRDAVDKAVEMMRQEKYSDALKVLNDVLTQLPDHSGVLMLIGTCHHCLGQDGIARVVLLKALELQPDLYEAMVNLAAVFRDLGDREKEILIWNTLHDQIGKNPDIEPDRIYHNMAGYFLNNGTPEKAEPLIRKVLSLKGERPDTMIQLGMCMLEQERWAEGWDAWDRALDIGERKHRNFWGLGETPRWDGTPGKNVVVYGEQGHGDEIMYASCLNELQKVCKNVYIDTSKPDLMLIYERSFPNCIVICTPDSKVHDVHTELEIDAAIPFGSLPTFYRRRPEDFPAHNGYIKAHPAKKREMRRRLDALGDGLKVGLAWRGGIPKTAGYNRNIPLEMFSPILRQNAHFISVQYTVDAASQAAMQEDVTGVPVHHWQSAIDDFDMLTALIDELDLLITVPQTALHQRGALGKKCWVIAGKRPPWPVGLTRDNCIWYPTQTRIFRQLPNEPDWIKCMNRVAFALSMQTGSKVEEISIPPINKNDQFYLKSRQI